MKKLIGMMLLVCLSSSMMSQQYHYYYGADPIPLELNTEHAYLLLNDVSSAQALEQLLGDVSVMKFDMLRPTATLDLVPGGAEDHERVWAEVQFLDELTIASYWDRLQELQDHSNILYAGPYFSKGGQKIGLSEFFLVKLKNGTDEALLLQEAQQSGVLVIGRNKFQPLWYTLAVTENTGGNALTLANYFYETGNYAAAEPDLMAVETGCVNDFYFADQWGMENTGQWGGSLNPDIHACDAWTNWTTGNPSMVIAVLDHGFEMDHPDLDANVFGTGYDTESGTSPAQLRGSHGTACTGIIGAEQGNFIGVTGIAPNCGLMSVSNSLLGTPLSCQTRADGIIWAYTHGAAVISNSWFSTYPYLVIADAIQEALQNGRGGLGTVIVFAAGNHNINTVLYPAYTHDDILVVGAMSPCGERKSPFTCDNETDWGSNYGTALDVVAPGVKILTTDLQGAHGYNPLSGTAGDYAIFRGTSSACPHVAGLAGLILTMNPCLTQHQVGDIIERTAQKIGPYTYSPTINRDNGTWDNEMGYGLIDVDAALRMTRELYIQNITVSTPKVYIVHGNIYGGNNVDPTQPAGDVHLNPGAKVELLASSSILLSPGFWAHDGSVVDAHIISTNCSEWDVNAREMATSVAPQTENNHALENRVGNGDLQQGKHLFSLYPNPTTGHITIEKASPDNATFTLYDLQGKRLIEGAILSASKTEIDLSGHPAGIYMMQIHAGQAVEVLRLMKQ